MTEQEIEESRRRFNRKFDGSDVPKAYKRQKTDFDATEPGFVGSPKKWFNGKNSQFRVS